MNTKNKKTNLFCAISLGSELGFFIVGPLAIFLFLGVFLDKKFDMLPLFTIVFLILSFAVVVLEMRYFILPFLEKRSQKNNK